MPSTIIGNMINSWILLFYLIAQYIIINTYTHKYIYYIAFFKTVDRVKFSFKAVQLSVKSEILQIILMIISVHRYKPESSNMSSWTIVILTFVSYKY